MTLSVYVTVLWLHIVAVFGFLLSHGASSWGTFSLRKERQPERIRALLDLSRTSLPMTYAFVLLIVGTGLANVYLGGWWGQLWPWTALGIGFFMSVTMSYFGTRYFNDVRKAIGLAHFEGRKRVAGGSPVSPEELEKLLKSMHAFVLTFVGVFGLLAILWLMVFKPF